MGRCGIEHPGNVSEDSISGHDRRWRCERVEVGGDPGAVCVPGDDHLEVIERLDRLREPANRLFLGIVHEGHLVHRRELQVGIADVAIWVGPQVAPERRAAAIERAYEHLAHEAGIGGIKIVGLAAQNAEERHVAVLRGDPRAGADQQPRSDREDLAARRVVLKVTEIGAVQVGHVQVLARRQRDEAQAGRQPACRIHLRVPRRRAHG